MESADPAGVTGVTGYALREGTLVGRSVSSAALQRGSAWALSPVAVGVEPRGLTSLVCGSQGPVTVFDGCSGDVGSSLFRLIGPGNILDLGPGADRALLCDRPRAEEVEWEELFYTSAVKDVIHRQRTKAMCATGS